VHVMRLQPDAVNAFLLAGFGAKRAQEGVTSVPKSASWAESAPEGEQPAGSLDREPAQAAIEHFARGAAAFVGLSRVHDLQDAIRLAMLREALRRTDGNVTRAARLLGVQRQAVQYMLGRYQL
jgi:transcriptional regulator with GAF, ATPase, and Fis domain